MADTATSSEQALCEECREPISVDAKKCPHCDYNPRQDLVSLAVIAPVLFLFLMFGSMFVFPPGIYLFLVLAILSPIVLIYLSRQATPAGGGHA